MSAGAAWSAPDDARADGAASASGAGDHSVGARGSQPGSFGAARRVKTGLGGTAPAPRKAGATTLAFATPAVEPGAASARAQRALPGATPLASVASWTMAAVARREIGTAQPAALPAGATEAIAPVLEDIANALKYDYGEPYVYAGLTNFRGRNGPALVLVNTATNVMEDTSWQWPRGWDSGTRQFEFSGSQQIEVSPDGTRVYVTTIEAGRPTLVVASAELVGADISQLVNSPTPLRRLDIIDVVPLIAEPAGRLEEDINGMAVSPDGRRVYLSTKDGYVKVVEDSALVDQFTVEGWGFGNFPGPLVVSPDGSRLYVVSEGGIVNAIATNDFGQPVATSGDVPSWRATPIASTIVDAGIPGEEGYRASAPKDIAITPDGKTVYVSFQGGYTRNFDDLSGTFAFAADNLEVLGHAEGSLIPQPVTRARGPLAMSPDGARLFVGSGVRRTPGITVVDTARGIELATANESNGWSVSDLVVSPDGRSAWVRTGSSAGFMSYSAVQRFDPFAMAFSSPRFSWVASGGDEGIAVGLGSSLVGSGVNQLTADGSCGCNRAPRKGTVTGYVDGSLAVAADGVVSGRISADDPDGGDTVTFAGYHLADTGGSDVVQLPNGATSFITAKGGVVTIQSSGEFTYQPSAEAFAVATAAGATARDEVDTFGVWAYDRSLSEPGGVTVIPVVVPITASVVASGPHMSVGDVTLDEGNTGFKEAVFTVLLSAPATSEVTVRYATADGTAVGGMDYTPVSGTLTFAAGDDAAEVRVAVVGDVAVESDETFNLTLSSPSGATLDTAVATGTILNDDAAQELPEISITGAAVTEGGTGTTEAAFTVTLSRAGAVPVSVSYTTVDGSAEAGSDYIAASGTLLFSPGQTQKTVNVTVLGDDAVESDEYFGLRLSAPSGATLAVLTANGRILNDDVEDVPVAAPGIIEQIQTAITQFVETVSGGFAQVVAWISDFFNSIVSLFFGGSPAEPASAVNPECSGRAALTAL